MKSIYTLLFLFFLLPASLAQNTKIDSIKSRVNESTGDTGQITQLNILAKMLRSAENYDEALLYAQQALSLGELLQKSVDPADSVLWKKIKAEQSTSWNHIGEIYRQQGIFPKAMECYLKLLSISEEIHNLRGIAAAYNNMGILFGAQKNYDEALRNYNEALKIREKQKDIRGIGSTFNNIGSIYIAQKKYLEALEYFIKARKIFEDVKDDQLVSSVLNNMGMIYLNLGNESMDPLVKVDFYKKSLEIHQRSYTIKKRLGNKRSLASALNNLGIAYTKLHQFEPADTCLSASLSLAHDVSSSDIVIDILGSIADYNAELGQYHAASGDNKKAAFYLEKSIEILREQNKLREEALNDESIKKIFQLQFQYRQEKIDRIKALEEQAKEERRKADATQQRIINWSVGCGLFLVIVFAVYVYRSLRVTQKQKKIIEDQKGLVEEKQKEIVDSIQYAKRIQLSLLPPEKYIERKLKELKK